MQAVQFDSLGRVRRALDDELFRVKPAIYWLDFVASTSVAWIAFWLTLPRFSPGLPARLLWFAISTLGFYRSLFFVHELVHIRSEKLRTFRWVWNVFCGSMFFLPEFTYLIHSSHHLTSTFSTDADPEYVPMAYQKPFELLAPFIIFPFAPLLMMLRFLIAAPVSWVVGGRFREGLLRNASSLKMNPKFEWTNISAEDRRLAVIQEVGCLVWWSLFTALAFAIGQPRIIVRWSAVSYCILTLNHIRSMVAHGYTNGTGERVSHEEQLLDSITIMGSSPIALVIAPVGLRYHSLHHLFPTIPYHSLGKAHHRLVKVLPPGHPYHKTLVPNLGSAFRAFFRTFRTNRS